MENDSYIPTRRDIIKAAGTINAAAMLGACTPEQKLTPAMVLKSLGISEGPALVYYTSSLCGSHSLANLTLIAEELATELKNKKPYAIDILDKSPKGTQKNIEKRIGDPNHPYGNLLTHTNHARTMIAAGPDHNTALRDARALGITVNSQNLENHTGEILLLDGNLEIIGKRLSTEDPIDTVKQYKQALERSRNTIIQR